MPTRRPEIEAARPRLRAGDQHNNLTGRGDPNCHKQYYLKGVPFTTTVGPTSLAPPVYITAGDIGEVLVVRDSVGNKSFEVNKNALTDYTEVTGDFKVQFGTFELKSMDTTIMNVYDPITTNSLFGIEGFGYESPSPPALEPRASVVFKQGMVLPFRAISTSPYTVSISDMALAPTGAPFTIDLNCNYLQEGQIFMIRAPLSGTTPLAPITILPQPGYTIGGAASLDLDTNQQVAWIILDDTANDWVIL